MSTIAISEQYLDQKDARIKDIEDQVDIWAEDWLKIRRQLKEANEVLNKIDTSLCERIIDDCGFDPDCEDWGDLNDIVKSNSGNSQKDLDLIREYKAKYKGE